jgi:maleylacetate reductase
LTEAFVYTALPARVLFGDGVVDRLSEEVDALGCSRAMVLATSHRRSAAEGLAAAIGERSAGIFAQATMHTPIAVTEQALAAATQLKADCLVAVGGGSTIGLSKAIAFRTDLPQVAIPTTYAGSEMTSILGETAQGRKVTQRSPRVVPEVVLYDPSLTLDLPIRTSSLSAMNAIAHAIEALYARNRNPVIDGLAERAIGQLAGALPRIYSNPHDRSARSDALLGAFYAGICLGAVDMGLHHKLCHILGGSFALPHAETHAALLPHVLAYNSMAAPDAMKAIGCALGTDDPAAALWDLQEWLGIAGSLAGLGLREEQIGPAAAEAVRNPYSNPREITASGVVEVLAAAFAGERPYSSP